MPLYVSASAGEAQELDAAVFVALTRFAEAYHREMCDFIETVRHGREPRVTGHDGRESLAVAVAAVQSFRERRPVRVESALRIHA